MDLPTRVDIRRQGECHDWIARLCSEYVPDIDIVILSLDTAVCGDAGNLLVGHGFDSLNHMLALGLVTASAQQPWELPYLMLSNVHIELEIVLHDGAAIMEHSAPHSEEAYASVLKNLPTACSLSSGLPALADAAVALRCASYQTNDAGLHGTPSVCTNYPCGCGAWRSQARCYFGWSRPSNWSLSRSTGESVAATSSWPARRARRGSSR